MRNTNVLRDDNTKLTVRAHWMEAATERKTDSLVVPRPPQPEPNFEFLPDASLPQSIMAQVRGLQRAIPQIFSGVSCCAAPAEQQVYPCTDIRYALSRRISSSCCNNAYRSGKQNRVLLLTGNKSRGDATILWLTNYLSLHRRVNCITS
jgi:hypothetical protein